MKQEIIEYIKAMLEDLDGQGLVITDDELIEDALKEYGDFSLLQKIVKGE